MRWLLVVLLTLACSGCEQLKKAQAMTAGATEEDRTDEPLDQVYISPNGLVTVHYPASFAAKRVGDATVVVSRNLTDGHDEALSFTAIETPISDDLKEFARVVEQGAEKHYNQFSLKARTATTCHGAKGIETTGAWKSKKSEAYFTAWSCDFIRDGHGYRLFYTTPERLQDLHGPMLKRIIDATTFPPAPEPRARRSREP